MSALLCLLFGHRTYPGVNKAESLTYHCPRCGVSQPGGQSARRR